MIPVPCVPQLILFGLSNQMVVTFKEENTVTFKHLFLKDYVDGAGDSYAVYTQRDLYDHVFYTVEKVRNVPGGGHGGAGGRGQPLRASPSPVPGHPQRDHRPLRLRARGERGQPVGPHAVPAVLPQRAHRPRQRHLQHRPQDRHRCVGGTAGTSGSWGGVWGPLGVGFVGFFGSVRWI